MDKTEFPSEWIVSSSPHVHSGDSVKRIMLDVVIALLPAFAAGIIMFGLDAVRLVCVCVGSCVVVEAACRKLMGRDLAISDWSAVVTGILLAFNLPPQLPSWIAVAGSVVAIAVAKQAFGGLGYNPFNPVLAARAALLVSRPTEMTSWSIWTMPSASAGVDSVTTATPLGMMKTSLESGAGMPYAFDSQTAVDFFIGRMNGCMGEVSTLALLAGGAYLLYRRCISWHTPVFFMGTVALFSGILWTMDSSANMNPLFHLLTGGVALGAIFMATDMVTTPVTGKGKIVFGIGCGMFTMIIRKWSSLPEGVSFAILLMNAVTPLIDRATSPGVFGHSSKKRKV